MTTLGTVGALFGRHRTANGVEAGPEGQVLSLFATGGGLVFAGDLGGRFKALDDKSGKVLWEVNLGSAVSGFPISGLAGGKQYIVASTGAQPVGHERHDPGAAAARPTTMCSFSPCRRRNSSGAGQDSPDRRPAAHDLSFPTQGAIRSHVRRRPCNRLDTVELHGCPLFDHSGRLGDGGSGARGAGCCPVRSEA